MELTKQFFDMFFASFDPFGKKIIKPDLAAQCRVALQAFHSEPRTQFRAKIQMLKKLQALPAVSTDFAKLTSDAFNVTLAENNFDLGYEDVFQNVPLGDHEDTWDIYDVTDGLTFVLVPEGDRILVEGMSGTVVSAHTDYYGGALGWTDKMIRFRKIAAMIDKARMFRNNFWANKADNFYLLLAAAAAINTTTYQGVAGDGQLRRDIATINRAAFTLTDRCKDKGYGDTAQAPLVMYANPLDRDRIEAAFVATTSDQAPALNRAQRIMWNIRRIYTFNSNIVAGAPQLHLPGNKIQKAEAMAPTTFVADKDVLTLNEVQAVWAIYGGAYADTDQAQTVTLG